MKNFIKSAIVLLSEAIWIYFVIALFASVEWDQAIFVPALWWLIAGIAGYTVNRLIGGKLHYIFVLLINIIAVTFIVIQNWMLAVPEGSWFFGIVLSLAVGFVYVRGASFVYKETTRMQMMQRFEFNIFIYLFLMFIFSANNWTNELFHVVFFSAIFGSLAGMILTLDSTEAPEEDERVEVRKVGDPRGFITVISVVFLSVIVVAALLFMPYVREKLQQFTLAGMNGVFWVFRQIGNFFAWIFSLFELPEQEGTPPEMAPQEQIAIDEVQEETVLSLPVEWIITIAAALICIVLLFIFGRFLKNRQPIRRPRPAVKSSKFKWGIFRNRFNEWKKEADDYFTEEIFKIL